MKKKKGTTSNVYNFKNIFNLNLKVPESLPLQHALVNCSNR